MIFEQIDMGGDRNFAYLVADPTTKQAALVDPGVNPALALEKVEAHGLELRYVINTHGHGDHSGGNDYLKRATSAKIAAHKIERVQKDIELEDGSRLQLGELTLEIIHTPGHSAGSLCMLVGDKLLTGDTLFVGKVGGTGPFFPGSSAEDEYRSLKRLMELPDHIEIYPGHNFYGGEGVKKSSTIGEERRTNPFILRDSLQAFRELKDNWEAYKREHGIR
jgi:glyoxylase-like metal-dependent hydrolase (beta-lactamase superfamily II)